MIGNLKRFFKPFTLERKTDDAYNGSVYNLVGTGSGFIQPVSGGEVFREGKAGEQATHRLYTQVGTPSVYGDKVTQLGESFIVLYAIQPAGIGAVDSHKEIILGLFK